VSIDEYIVSRSLAVWFDAVGLASEGASCNSLVEHQLIQEDVTVAVKWFICWMFKESLEVESSLESDRLIQLTVVRHQGTRGRVLVSWVATATVDSSAVFIQPNNGTVCYHILLCYVVW